MRCKTGPVAEFLWCIDRSNLNFSWVFLIELFSHRAKRKFRDPVELGIHRRSQTCFLSLSSAVCLGQLREMKRYSLSSF